jgi:hypothetical protein
MGPCFEVEVMKTGSGEGTHYAQCWLPVRDDEDMEQDDVVVYVRTRDANLAATLPMGRRFRVRLEPLDN